MSIASCQATEMPSNIIPSDKSDRLPAVPREGGHDAARIADSRHVKQLLPTRPRPMLCAVRSGGGQKAAPRTDVSLCVDSSLRVWFARADTS